MTTVAGQLMDARNQPLRDATVLMFPSDADKWFETSQTIRTTRPDQQGQWTRVVQRGDRSRQNATIGAKKQYRVRNGAMSASMSTETTASFLSTIAACQPPCTRAIDRREWLRH